MLLTRIRPALVLAAAIVAAGCSGTHYSIRPPYDEKIKTVYVPVFRSRTFRRDLNQMLTEEVVKEIERRTPYKVVGRQEDADTTLDGEINFSDKNLMLPDASSNLPRQLTATMTANVRWTDNRAQKPIGDPSQNQGAMTISTIYNFFPEVGETTEAAFLRSCQYMAKEIVGAMEKPW